MEGLMTPETKNMGLAFLTILCCVCSRAAAEESKPNLIFILVDDQGYYDLGCYGGAEFDTPRIDRMAREGIRFTDYYAAAPICSPSRAGILTGCYPRRVGLETWLRNSVHRQMAPRLSAAISAQAAGIRSLLWAAA
jgi:arylsulfatase A-like enzyme